MEATKQLVNRAKVGLYEYLLIASPEETVFKRVMAEKAFFAVKYKQKNAVKTQPHITIANFVAREPMEETIIRYTERICNRQQSFEVTINNYSGFPEHSIILRIQNHQPFNQLAKELKVVNDYISSCSCPGMELPKKPHLTIARGLPADVYAKAIIEYSQNTFHETFMVDELLLLRRSNEYDKCKLIHVFRLPPTPHKPFENLLFNN